MTLVVTQAIIVKDYEPKKVHLVYCIYRQSDCNRGNLLGTQLVPAGGFEALGSEGNNVAV